MPKQIYYLHMEQQDKQTTTRWWTRFASKAVASHDEIEPSIAHLRAALEDWLALRGAWEGPLFVPVNKGGRLGRRRMTEQAVYGILHKRATEAGVDDLSPHDLRRTYVGDLLDRGADIATVQKLAGHADVSTTARYDRRGGAARRAAADLLHVPYARRRP